MTKFFPLDTAGPYSLIAIWDRANDAPAGQLKQPTLAVQPATPDIDVSSAPSRRSAERPVSRHSITLRPATPLYDNLIANLEPAVRSHPCGHPFIDYITQCCFFGSLLTMDPFGQPIDKPVPLAVKMEELLRTAQRQRELHLERLKRRCGRAQAPPNNLRMTNEDMKEIYNEWRKDVQSWMRESTLATYEELNHSCRHQEAHQLGKRTFSAYLFQLSGCKFLLHKLIELPLISQSSADSAEQPVTTLLADLINSYEEHKTTSKYQEAVRRSAEHQAS